MCGGYTHDSTANSTAVWTTCVMATGTCCGLLHKGKGEGIHTLDIAPLRSESPPQKRSGMARVLKGFHSFT